MPTWLSENVLLVQGGRQQKGIKMKLQVFLLEGQIPNFQTGIALAAPVQQKIGITGADLHLGSFIRQSQFIYGESARAEIF